MVALSPQVDARLKRLDGMLSGKRALSELETLCIQRQMGDLQTGHERGLEWDEEEAQRSVEFAKLMRHWKGRQFIGKPFEPEAWQEELVFAPLFGWRRYSPEYGKMVRRFVEGYKEVPRKNGKSFLSSVIANQGLLADGEYGPEVYSAASLKEQAGIVYKDCKMTLTSNPLLEKQVKTFANRIECPANNGVLRAIGSDYNDLQGLNPSRVIIDELHAHKKRDTYDAILTGMGNRENAILFCITTAGFDRSTICWERRQYAERVLSGDLLDDTFFSFIACADEKDDFSDPDVWWKANPNLGVSVFRDFLAREAKQAREIASKENSFRRLYLNQWTEQSVRWLQMHEWDKCQEDYTEEDFYGEECIAAIDLAKGNDVTALVLLFRKNDKFFLLPYFWISEKSATHQADSDKRIAKAYADAGHIRKMPGTDIDFEVLSREMVEIMSKFRVQDVVTDPWYVISIRDRFKELGVEDELIGFTQNYANYAAPTIEFARLLGRGEIKHNGNPVLRFMASSVVVSEDPNGNLKPDRRESVNKIDGICASIMALGQWMAREVEEASVYETRGVRVL